MMKENQAQPAPTVSSTPTLGRVVHYVLANGEHRAALVVREGGAHPALCVMLDAALDAHLPVTQAVNGLLPESALPFARPAFQVQVEDVPEDRSGQRPHSWHWPERA